MGLTLWRLQIALNFYRFEENFHITLTGLEATSMHVKMQYFQSWTPPRPLRRISLWSITNVIKNISNCRYLLYMFYVMDINTNWYQLVTLMSVSNRSNSGTWRITSWWCTAGFFFYQPSYIIYVLCLVFKT